MSTLTYTKGLHVIVDLEQCQINCDQMESFRTMIMQEIAICDLHVLGSVFHAFDNGAFTAVVCLTESHLSVHTWPEFGRVTFDVFLSNYLEVNDDKAHRLALAITDFFKGEIALRKEVER
jgi:S-adenosylmethionine decarboxylase